MNESIFWKSRVCEKKGKSPKSFYLVEFDLLALESKFIIIYSETIEPREPVDFNNYRIISLLTQLLDISRQTQKRSPDHIKRTWNI